MDDSTRAVATLTVTVDDATLSLTATDSNPVGTELVGPDVAGDLRLRVDTGRAAIDRRFDDAGPSNTERATTTNGPSLDTAGDGSTAPEHDGSTTDDPAGDGSITDDPLGDDSSSPGDESRARFEVYEDRAGEFRWRLVHDNGNVIADSGEGYATWRGAENGLRSVKANAPGAPVERL